jgi:polysaccharide export outer membrane protein
VAGWRAWGCVALALVACSPKAPRSRVALEAPVESTSLGPGDVITLQIVGEKDLPLEYQVARDGTVDLPYLHQVEVAGLEPQEVGRLVRQQLIEAQILRDPSVVVRVMEYRSKQVNVLGQVQKPGSFPHEPGMTLVQAVSLAGGLNSIALANRVRLTRRVEGGRSVTVEVNLEAITAGDAEDIPLQVGDRIYVEDRIF